MAAPKAVAKVVVTTRQGRVMAFGLAGGVDKIVAQIETVLDSNEPGRFFPVGVPAGPHGGAMVRVGSIASIEIVPVGAEEKPAVDIATLREIAADAAKLGDRVLASSIRIAIGDEKAET